MLNPPLNELKQIVKTTRIKNNYSQILLKMQEQKKLEIDF